MHKIWAAPCCFKFGAPVLGGMGTSIENVVVMRVETWTALCREHPTLGATQFNVGMNDSEDPT